MTPQPITEETKNDATNGHAPAPPHPIAEQRPAPAPSYATPPPVYDLHDTPADHGGSSAPKTAGLVALGVVAGATGGFVLGRITSTRRRLPLLGWRRRAVIGTAKRAPAITRGTFRTVKTARHPVRRIRG
jgi:hypothetical protein